MKFKFYQLEADKNLGLILYDGEPWFLLSTDVDINLPLDAVADMMGIDRSRVIIQPIKGGIKAIQTT